MSNTVKVRIAVAVNDKGKWYAVGWSFDPERYPDSGEEMMDQASEAVWSSFEGTGEVRTCWFEGEAPLPEALTVQGEVVDNG